MNGIVKDTPESSLIPSLCEDMIRKWQHVTRKRVFTRNWPHWCLNIRFLASRSVKNKFLLFKPFKSFFVQAAWANWDRYYCSFSMAVGGDAITRLSCWIRCPSMSPASEPLNTLPIWKALKSLWDFSPTYSETNIMLRLLIC